MSGSLSFLAPSFVLLEHLVLSFSYIHIYTAFYRSKKKKNGFIIGLSGYLLGGDRGWVG